MVVGLEPGRVTIKDSSASSLDWSRIAALRPRLAADAFVYRHCYRGVPWYVVQDSTSGRHVRLGEGAWRIVGLMNGDRTLEEIQQALAQNLGDTGPTQDSVIQVLCDLHGTEFLECPQLNDARQLAARQRRHDSMRWRSLLASPVSQRIALVDPQSWLDRRLPIVKPLLTRAGFVVWLATVLVGLWLMVTNWADIAAGLSSNVLSAHNLGMMVAAYLIVKTLHECGHAFATRVFGGEVHEMGVMFLVFLPVPYVDASASSAFPEKSRRIVVGAAGIMVEMFLSVVALAVWLAVEPGLVRDFAFNVLLVAGISTLLFNGNPLLRFDGYYVLCDAIEIPNLGARSTRYLGYLVQRYLFGAPGAQSPVSAAGENRWFIGYGITSAIYRVGILAAIGLFVAQRFPVVGVVLCIWLAITQALLPVMRGIKGLVGAPVLVGHRRRATLVLGVPLVLVLLGAATIPLPAWTYAEGVVWLPERAQVRASADGFVSQQVAQRGTHVEAGDTLFTLDGAALQSEAAVLERGLEEHQARYDAALFHDRARIAILRQQLKQAQASLDNARSRASDLSVRSPLTGTLVVPDARRLQGRYVHEGELLGYVADERPQIVRVAVSQGEIDLVREGTRTVRIKIPGFLERTLTGQIGSVTPSAVRELPSAALGASGGGRIPIDGADPSGHTPADSVFVLEVVLRADAPRLAVGTRVYLRFEHQGATLGDQLHRTTRQLLLAHLGV